LIKPLNKQNSNINRVLAAIKDYDLKYARLFIEYCEMFKDSSGGGNAI